MPNKILWIDDDYNEIRGVFRHLEKNDYEIIHAFSIYQGYKILSEKIDDYDLIVSDIILPLNDENNSLPDLFRIKPDAYNGIKLIRYFKDKWLNKKIVILSVIQNPIEYFHLEDINIDLSIFKIGLMPLEFSNQIKQVLNSKKGEIDDNSKTTD